MGYTEDTLYATKIDPSVANLKVALACDSIRMNVNNVVGNATVSDSIGILISHSNIVKGGENALNDIFTFNRAKIKITHGGNDFSCSIDTTKLRVVRTDSTKAMYFDLHECLTSLGIMGLVKGDSVNFDGLFTVNPDGPYNFRFEKIPNLRAMGYQVVDDSLYACDNYGDVFRVGRSKALFSFGGAKDSIFGCREANIEVKLTMFNNDFSTFFGEEYRKAVGVDSVFLTFDPNFVRGFKTEVEASIPNHPAFGNDYFPLPNLDTTGFYALRFDTLKIVPSLNRLTDFAFNLRVKATPNCGTVTASQNGNNVYAFKPKVHYRDRFYALELGDGSCSPYLIDSAATGNDVIVYNDPPALSFESITNPNITIVNDTAEWKLKICNTSAKGKC
ncbi:MAG: hypothetical protein HC817_13630 [Saprospiraceae bacterium]|nr:hypothetical protein [Saprospiraceae bacterium]